MTDFKDGVDHIEITFVEFSQLTITDSAAGAVMRFLDGVSPTMVLTGLLQAS